MIHINAIVFEYLSISFIQANWIFEPAQAFTPPQIYSGVKSHQDMKILVASNVLNLVHDSLVALLLIKLV